MKKPGWLKIQFEKAVSEINAWPEWLCRARGVSRAKSDSQVRNAKPPESGQTA